MRVSVCVFVCVCGGAADRAAQDMNSDTDLYRGNAIRVLSRIVDADLLAQIEVRGAGAQWMGYNAL